MSNSSSISKSGGKKVSIGRERDKSKTLSAESVGFSQCDTPPMTEKVQGNEGNSPQGRYAGISPDSVQIMAEQIGVEISPDVAANLAEDVSYKLRQTICTIGLHSALVKKSQVDCSDVNSVLILSDTSPIVGLSSVPYTAVPGDDKICCQMETLVNLTDVAMCNQSCAFTNPPTMAVEWVTDERSLIGNTSISIQLQNYYTKVARAILNLRKKPKDVAVEDLTTNTRIGPIFPNLFNLAVLVLNDDNLNALNVPAKKPLQSNVLDMVDALCSNPCSMDTNIQQQFQRLFPVMVSNILGNGSLADKMVAILTKIIRTWPSFVMIGKSILFDYLSQGTKERLTAPMIRCVMALGRKALIQCLEDHLDYLDMKMCAPRRSYLHTDLRETLLDSSSILLRSEPTTFLEDYVTTDYTLFELFGDSIEPRRMIFPYTDTTKRDDADPEKVSDEDIAYAVRPTLITCRIKCIPHSKTKPPTPMQNIFDSTFNSKRLKCCIYLKIRNCRSKDISRRLGNSFVQKSHSNAATPIRKSLVIAKGHLDRHRFKLKKKAYFPILGVLML